MERVFGERSYNLSTFEFITIFSGQFYASMTVMLLNLVLQRIILKNFRVFSKTL